MINGDQIKAARKLLGWSQQTLGMKASVTGRWVREYEQNGLVAPSEGRVSAMVSALEAAGVEFTGGTSPGVRLRKSP